MKILMFGRGVIATLYGWALAKAGNTVEFYVRPGRAAQYGAVVKLNIRDARRNAKGVMIGETWPQVLREDLPVDHDYDLIVVSLSHPSVAAATAFLGPRVGKATVLMFNNLWIEPHAAVAALPAGQVVWGFPGAGGGFDAQGTLNGGLLKTVSFGILGTASGARDLAVRNLFTAAGFRVAEQADFRSWLWLHFILNAGILSQALKAGGVSKLINSTGQLKQAFLNIRELLPLVRARGGTVRLADSLPYRLPAGLLGWVLRKTMLGEGSLGRWLMENANSPEIKFFGRDALAEARKLGVAVPRLAAMESLFSEA